jgi:aspartate aminotransferase-like enzyme
MGYTSQSKHVLLFLAALEKVLLDQGFHVAPGAGVGSALQVYSHAEPVGAGAKK